MDFKKINEIWDRFEKSNLEEIELGSGENYIRLKKPSANSLIESKRIVVEDTGNEVPKNSSDLNSIISINAPLVGTFFKAPAPDKEPFVKEGDKVNKGDVIGIIEAMKLMNNVTADKAGIVTKILVEDGDMVQYGQPIIELR